MTKVARRVYETITKFIIFLYFLANAYISPFNTQTMHIKLYTTAQLCFPKNLIPWRDSNPGLLVPKADAMSTVTYRQGITKKLAKTIFCQI
jgi:hypothetical protein